MKMTFEQIGTNAGVVWRILNVQVGPISLPLLGEKANFSPNELYMALGWLAREGKLYFSTTNGETVVSLTPLNLYL